LAGLRLQPAGLTVFVLRLFISASNFSTTPAHLRLEVSAFGIKAGHLDCLRPHRIGNSAPVVAEQPTLGGPGVMLV